MFHSKSVAGFLLVSLACTGAAAQAQTLRMTPQLGSVAPKMDAWSRKIAAQITAHQEYPRSAQIRNAEGLVKVRVTIDANGALVGTEIIQSSAFDVLNREAVKTIERAAPFPAPPGGARFLLVPLVWKLN
jgi:periplasmic protein TonB